MIAYFNGVGAEYKESVPKSTRLKLAYVKHDFNRQGFPFTFYPDVITVQNNGSNASENKGNDIFFRGAWWRFIEKLNAHDIKSYGYVRSVGSMLINTASKYDIDVPYSIAHGVSVICGGNFISYIDETATHVRIDAFDNWLKADQVLDTKIHNWFDMPYKFMKLCAVQAYGSKVRNPTNGIDVYFPIIAPHAQVNLGHPAELWIAKSKIEILGEGDYVFRDGSVYDEDGALVKHHGVVPPA